MNGEAVYEEAERLCREKEVKESNLSHRTMFETSKLAPLSNGARERYRRAANHLAFEKDLILV